MHGIKREIEREEKSQANYVRHPHERRTGKAALDSDHSDHDFVASVVTGNRN